MKRFSPELKVMAFALIVALAFAVFARAQCPDGRCPTRQQATHFIQASISTPMPLAPAKMPVGPVAPVAVKVKHRDTVSVRPAFGHRFAAAHDFVAAHKPVRQVVRVIRFGLRNCR